MNEKGRKSDSTPASKTCVACASEIPGPAKKCVHCGGYQNWRRYVDFGNTSLALLIALLTVIGSLSDKLLLLYTEFFSANNPSVVKSIRFLDDKRLTIIFSNIGKSRALVDSGVLCRIPIVKRGIELARSNLAEFRNPRPTEIEASIVMSFTSLSRNQIIEPKSSLAIEYKLLERFPEKDVAFRLEVQEISGYCHVGLRDIYGEHHSEFMPVSALNLYFLQEPLRNKPTIRAREK